MKRTSVPPPGSASTSMAGYRDHTRNPRAAGSCAAASNTTPRGRGMRSPSSLKRGATSQLKRPSQYSSRVMTTTSPPNGSAGAGATMTSSALDAARRGRCANLGCVPPRSRRPSHDVDRRDGEPGLRRTLEHDRRRSAKPPTQRARTPRRRRPTATADVSGTSSPRSRRRSVHSISRASEEHGPAHAREPLFENVRNAAPPTTSQNHGSMTNRASP